MQNLHPSASIGLWQVVLHLPAMFRLRVWLRAWLVMLLLLTACQREDTLENRYLDYQQRIANLLDQELPVAVALPEIRFPDQRSRLSVPPDFEQGLVEVWDFRRCQLMQLINQRNSNLGRVMRPSQRFIYENQFWNKLVPCYEQRQQWQDDDPDFVQRLEATYRHKLQIQPQILNQMLFVGEELPRQLSQSNQPFMPDARPDYAGVSDALSYLADLSSSAFDVQISGVQLEAKLQQLYQQPLLHSLLKSLQISRYHLNRAADILEQRLAKRPVCLTGRPTPTAKALFNVLQKYYLAGIQPVIAHHNRMASTLLPPLNRIFAATPLPAPLSDYWALWIDQDNANGLWYGFLQANQRHITAWNQLLLSCGLNAPSVNGR